MSAILQVDKYFAALQRLINRGAKISNDAVALEAGSGRGSIKKSRAAYCELIVAIDKAAQDQTLVKTAADPLPALRQQKDDVARQLDNALEREAALLDEVLRLRAEVKQLREHSPKKLVRLPPIEL